MQNLHVLAQHPQRTTLTTIQIRGTHAKRMKPMNDTEIRTIRKAILLLLSQKGFVKIGVGH
jgi:hypothetical protein